MVRLTPPTLLYPVKLKTGKRGNSIPAQDESSNELILALSRPITIQHTNNPKYGSAYPLQAAQYAKCRYDALYAKTDLCAKLESQQNSILPKYCLVASRGTRLKVVFLQIRSFSVSLRRTLSLNLLIDLQKKEALSSQPSAPSPAPTSAASSCSVWTSSASSS